MTDFSGKFKLVQGDITRVTVDAIVNAANNSLLGGGGVDGAIHRAGGRAILEECKKIRARQGGCPTGKAVITTAGRLPAQFVIHTVGPVWQGGTHGEDQLLASCYQQSIKLAELHQLSSIAFPNISTGVYGFPKARAVQIAIQAIRDHLPQCQYLQQVMFICHDHENYDLYQDLLNR
ncbi:O-acetyl-ADP-ribose deacetylase [Alkanindiges illinoisensis]|uniref:O-acetyl-ADP-ribose deacetylase n=1 Tax=Alkanindiges illinoisensis TaxID=197183 RepID=A0A4Y7XDB4_9GAMM|nr:O-acetyl-ADP-ribose deacetylase [Alkanindiges illinoisensis]TEU28587.1 O-acetyl-ADP-ribose deacetylase [Alkanindiges illinoisensis]